MASGPSNSGDPEFQIAPLVDVLLVLLIFFMSIATTTVAKYDPRIVLPTADSAAKKETAMSEGIFNVHWDSAKRAAEITFNSGELGSEGKLVDMSSDAIVKQLARAAKADSNYKVVIRADRATPNRVISQVMNLAARAGIADVQFSTLLH